MLFTLFLLVVGGGSVIVVLVAIASVSFPVLDPMVIWV